MESYQAAAKCSAQRVVNLYFGFGWGGGPIIVLCTVHDIFKSAIRANLKGM